MSWWDRNWDWATSCLAWAVIGFYCTLGALLAASLFLLAVCLATGIIA